MKKSILFLAFSAALLAGCSDSSDATDTTAKPPAEQTSATTKPAEKAEAPATAQEEQVPLGITLKNFEKRYNRFAGDVNKLDAGVRMERLTIAKTDPIKGNEAVHVFNSCAGKNTCVLGSVQKDSGELLSLSLIATGDGTQASGVIALSHLIIGTAAAIPQVKTFKETSSQITALLQGKGEFSNSIEFQGYKLEFQRSNILGNFLTIKKEPAAKPVEQVAPVKQKVVTIDLKLNDLKNRYNKFATEFNKTNTGLVLKPINEITDLRLGNEAQALYQGCSTKYTCLSGLYDTASGKIISISVKGNPSKEEPTGLVALSHLIVGTCAATPSAPKFNSLTKVVSELIDGQGYFIKETTFKGYHYEFRRDDVIGNELTVKKLP